MLNRVDSITASCTVLALSRSVHYSLMLAEARKYNDNPQLGDLPLLASLYNEINGMILSSPRPPPRSMESALKRCDVTQKTLLDMLSDLGYARDGETRWASNLAYKVKRYFRRQELVQAQTQYRESVLLLRDIAMDSETHHSLEELRRDIIHLIRAPNPFGITDDSNRSTISRSMSFAATNESQCWTFYGTILCSGKGSAERKIPVNVLWDTGSSCSQLVSHKFLSDNSLLHMTESLEKPQTLNGLGNRMSQAEKKVNLNWYHNSDHNSLRQTEFLVVEDQDFELLLGGYFLRQNNLATSTLPPAKMVDQPSPEGKVLKVLKPRRRNTPKSANPMLERARRDQVARELAKKTGGENGETQSRETPLRQNSTQPLIEMDEMTSPESMTDADTVFSSTVPSTPEALQSFIPSAPLVSSGVPQMSFGPKVAHLPHGRTIHVVNEEE